MRCERCGANTRTTPYEVDGFTGRLCNDCREAWDRLRSGHRDIDLEFLDG